MIGMRFGRLVVIAANGRNHVNKPIWTCRCDCGVTRDVLENNLKSNHTRSCGCLAREIKPTMNVTHGDTVGRRISSEFSIWWSMRQRCTNPNSKAYKYYGGRGISVCERWQSFDTFLADMGRRPSTQYSIDRINNDGNYEPGNCRWATRSEQACNQRRGHRAAPAA